MNTKKVFKSLLVLNLLLVSLMLLTGCSIQTKDTTARASTKETIKIGVVLPLTGPSADGGNYVKNGLLLAQDELNKAEDNADQDLAYHYELLFQDSMYDPKTAVSAVRKLIDSDQVKYIVGAQGSSETLAITPIAEENKVILITPGSQSDKISQAGDYIFRTQVNTAQESPFLAEHIFKAIGSKPLGLLLLNTEYGESIINNFNPKFESLGGNIAGVERFEPKETDYRTPLSKLKEKGARFILMGALRQNGGHIIKQAKELDMKVRFFATSPIEGKELLEIAGEAAEGLEYSYPYDPKGSGKEEKEFREKYKAVYGSENEMLSANGYDTLKILSQCIEQEKSDVEKVKTCLYTIKEYAGASGVFSLDQNGDAVKHMIIKTVKDRTFIKLG